MSGLMVLRHHDTVFHRRMAQDLILYFLEIDAMSSNLQLVICPPGVLDVAVGSLA
jgi:hypothetical protein